MSEVKKFTFSSFSEESAAVVVVLAKPQCDGMLDRQPTEEHAGVIHLERAVD